MFGFPLARWTSQCRLTLPIRPTACTAITAIGLFGVLGVAEAAGLGLKPGLWDVRLVRQIVDGHDVSAQLTESVAKTQTALGKLAPAARARAEKKFHAGDDSGSNTSFRICLTPAMAATGLPVLEQDGSCRPTMTSQSGHQVTFRIQCSANGAQIKGRGQAASAGMLITAKSDVITRASDGSSHTLHNEMQMRYLGADCGNVLPPGRAVPAPNRR